MTEHLAQGSPFQRRHGSWCGSVLAGHLETQLFTSRLIRRHGEINQGTAVLSKSTSLVALHHQQCQVLLTDKTVPRLGSSVGDMPPWDHKRGEESLQTVLEFL